MEFNTILKEMGPAWDTDVVKNAYNLNFDGQTYVHRHHQAIGLSRPTSAVQQLRTRHLRKPPYLFRQQIVELTLNPAYTLLRMLTGETKKILAAARGIQT